MPDLDNDLVRERERWYASRPDYIERMTERSASTCSTSSRNSSGATCRPSWHCCPSSRAHSIPQAVSQRQAAGMWQFMPATGKDFELKQNVFRDDRRDVLASTRAALDYLQKLHGMFGDWHLALAAYNWGEGSVGSARSRRTARPAWVPSYEDLKMPGETAAVRAQAAGREEHRARSAQARYGAAGDRKPSLLPVASTSRATSTWRWQPSSPMWHSRTSRRSIRRRNKPVILAAGTPQILLPWDNAATFRANLQANADAPAGQLDRLAGAVDDAPGRRGAQRSDMSEADLRAVNQIPNGMVIKAGSTLLVRRSAQVREDVAEPVADNAQLSLGRQSCRCASSSAPARTTPWPAWRAATRSSPATWPSGTSCRYRRRSSRASASPCTCRPALPRPPRPYGPHRRARADATANTSPSSWPRD